MIIGILAMLAVVGWMRYFAEKERTKFFRDRTDYWYGEAVELRKALVNNIRKDDDTIGGDEWKKDCEY